MNIDSLIPLGFATLEPFNRSATDMFDEISHALQQLPPTLRCNIRTELKRPMESDRSDADLIDRKTDSVETQPKYRGHYSISFRRKDDGSITFIWTFGRGATEQGEARGVTHLIGCPGKRPRGVAPLHMDIRCDCVTGQFYIVALDDRHPVTVYPYHKPEVLRKGQYFLIPHKRMLIALGELQFIWAFDHKDRLQLFNYLHVRNNAFKIAGLQQPDEIFEPLPTNEPRHQAGTVVLHPALGKGAWGYVWSGVDIHTLQPRAVKEMLVCDNPTLDQIWQELVINLNYQNCVGLMQASEIRDDRDNSWGPGQIEDLFNSLRESPFPYKIYIIMRKATDFWRWSLSKPSLDQIIMMFRGPIEGAVTIHGDKYIHGDITTVNLFVLPNGCNGALGDFGKAVQRTTAVTFAIGPPATLAPEVDGRHPYTNAIDIWSMGFALLTMAQPVVETWPTYSKHCQQTAEWFNQTFRFLDGLVQASTSPVWLWRILRRMLAINPAERPSMKDVLARWPAPPPLVTSSATITGSNSQQRKAPSPSGRLNSPTIPRSPDSGTGRPMVADIAQQDSIVVSDSGTDSPTTPCNLPQTRTLDSVSEAATKLANPTTESKVRSMTNVKAPASAIQSRVTPDPSITRPTFNEFDDLYTKGPQAGGRDQTLQKSKSSIPLNVHAVRATKSTSSLSHKRTVSSVCDAADKSRNIKLAKPRMESASPSIKTNTDADTSATTSMSVSNAKDTSLTTITETLQTEPAAEIPETLEPPKDDLDYLFEEEEQTITSLALTV